MLPLAEWSDTSLATMAYGQGIAATPLQMTSVFATIANDGRWMQPRLVRGIVDPTGTYRDLAPPQTRRVVTAETAQMVTRMLAFAVEHGTGVNAQVPGFQVAGKTGTARIPAPDRPGYLVGEYIASFIGYLPAGDPQGRRRGDPGPPGGRVRGCGRRPAVPGRRARRHRAAAHRPGGARGAATPRSLRPMSPGMPGGVNGQAIGSLAVAHLPARTLGDLVSDIPRRRDPRRSGTPRSPTFGTDPTT